jgi:dihydrofolate reductase
MKKMFLFMVVSLDGYFEGPGHDLSWHRVDDEFNEFALDQLHAVDGLVFGRRTYELMAGFWPKMLSDWSEGRLHGSSQPSDADLRIAERMDALPKFVFSRTLREPTWRNTRVISDNVREEVRQLKELPGRDLAIFGSSNRSVTLAELGLIDECRLMINPVVLGAGTPLLHGLDKKLDLELTGSRTFRNGNVLLSYRPGP